MEGVRVAQSAGTGEDGFDVRGIAGQAGRRDEKRTVIVLDITHYKDLPPEAASTIAQRFYGWAFSKGVEVGVKASVLE